MIKIKFNVWELFFGSLSFLESRNWPKIVWESNPRFENKSYRFRSAGTIFTILHPWIVNKCPFGLIFLFNQNRKLSWIFFENLSLRNWRSVVISLLQHFIFRVFSWESHLEVPGSWLQPRNLTHSPEPSLDLLLWY